MFNEISCIVAFSACAYTPCANSRGGVAGHQASCKEMINGSNCSELPELVQVIVGGLNAASGIVSLLASCLVVALVVLFKKWQFFTQRLVLYLAISVAFQSITAMIMKIDYNNETSEFYIRFCRFSGFVSQNATWMVLNAVASITVYIFVCAVFSKQTDRFEVLYLFLIFVFPLLLNWIPFIDSAYGKAGVWCWIRSTEDDSCTKFVFGRILEFVLWYVPLYLILTVLLFLYVIILVKIHCFDRGRWTGNYKHTDDQHQIKMMSREIRSLLRYPLIYFLISLFPLSLRICKLFDVDTMKLIPLWILTAIFFPIQGGFIALAFTLDPDTRKRLRWVQIKAAAKELCQRDGKNVISEYPAEHVISDTEKSLAYKTSYRALRDHADDIDLVAS